MRNRVLGANPLCAMCGTSFATELDHIVALSNGGTNEEGNLQGLCAACHEIKTAHDLGRRPRITTGADGWPVEDAMIGPRWRRALS